MRDLLDALLPAWEAGRTAALATVVRTFDSAPRPPGAGMVVEDTGTVSGSVSGGCVEGAVYELGTGCIEDGVPVLTRYGVSDEDAFAVGLTCGGTIDVFVEPVNRTTFEELPVVAAAIRAGRPIGVATVIGHPDPARLGKHLVLTPEGTTGSLGSSRMDDAVADDALGLLAAGRNSVLTYGPEGERLDAGMSVFFAAFAPAPRLLVFGAIDFASALARLGAFLGYRVTVCDARAVFATPARFPGAEDVVVAWPHDYYAEQVRAGLIDARTVVCVLTHDPKFDVPLLETVLNGPGVAYIGAMGSRRTHEDRVRRLLESGIRSEQLALIHSPVGLDLGARTPEETAVSIAAEFISEAWGGSNVPLRSLNERIHHDEMPSLANVPSLPRVPSGLD